MIWDKNAARETSVTVPELWANPSMVQFGDPFVSLTKSKTRSAVALAAPLPTAVVAEVLSASAERVWVVATFVTAKYAFVPKV